MINENAFLLRHLLSAAAAATLLLGTPVSAQPASSASPQCYSLVDGSQITDDCPVCDRLPIVRNLRGSFQLRFVQQNPLFTTYAVEDMALTAGETNGPYYLVKGSGTYEFGGEVALRQELYLNLQIFNGLRWDACQFTNASGAFSRAWPMVSISVDQTNGTMTQQYRLDINAAPFRELWFSTAKSFTAGTWNPPTNAISAGDSLSMSGRVVFRNTELTRKLGIMPMVPDLGLKDIDVLPGGEVVFSLEQPVFSEVLGALSPGDLLGNSGRIFRKNSQLLANFPTEPPTPSDLGLAAVQVSNSGEVFFSVQQPFFAVNLGTTVQPGDLLSEKGYLFRSGAQLLARFAPAKPDVDYGLTSVFVWPTNSFSGLGEIWFSTRDGFSDSKGRYYAPGDLLSDQGYVVYTNQELVAAFGPAVAASLGMDALFLVTSEREFPDGIPLRAAVPQIVAPPPASVQFNWQGPGRVFQVERASTVQAPYEPVSPIVTEGPFVDPSALTQWPAAFYRIRQW